MLEDEQTGNGVVDTLTHSHWKTCSGSQVRQIAYCVDPGEEEVGPAHHRDELREPGQPGPHRVARDGEAGASIMAGHQGVRVLVKAIELGVIDPCVLDELELAGDIGAQAYEVQSPLGPVVGT